MASGTVLLLSAAAIRALREEAVAAYPRECCGFLVGSASDGRGRVDRIRSAPNRHSEAAGTGYRIDPGAYLVADCEARAEGSEILGVYHSHPEGSSVPSERDRREAIPGWSYLVLAVSRGEPGPPVSWRLSGGGRRFHRESLEVTEA